MDFLQIIEEHYPNSTGAILTGSYLSNDYSKSLSDIDILIIDPIFSAISPLCLYYQGVRIDFTQVPANDLDNTLRNEQFDQRGILLTMLANGKIIKDNSLNTISKLKTEGERLFNEGIYDNLTTYKALIKGLSKIKKEFLKDLKSYQRSFLINEVFYYVSQIELIKSASWRMSGRHKADYLYVHNQGFFDDLIELISKAQSNHENSFKRIGSFVDTYLTSLAHINQNRRFSNKYVVVDIDLENLQIEFFAAFIVEYIKQSEVLASSYLYYYLSDNKMNRVYKNKVSICFENINEIDYYTFEGIISEVFKVFFEEQLKLKFRISTIASFHINEINANNTFFSKFDSCSTAMSELMNLLIVKYGRHDVTRHLVISTIINSFLLNYLKIADSDKPQIMNYLLSRYILTKQEQSKLNPKTIHEERKKKIMHLSGYIQENIQIFIEALNKGKTIAGGDEAISNLYYNDFIEKLTAFLMETKDSIGDLKDENSFTIENLQTLVKDSDIDNCLMFILVFQKLQPLLLLNENQSSIQLILLSTTSSHG